MATRIRLRRMGAKKRPFYRVVVADQRAPRDGRFIEVIGKYHPLNDPSLIEIDEDRAIHWLRVGAQPSSQVRNLMSKLGIWEKFVAERPSAVLPAKPERVAKEKVSKKAQAKAAEPEQAAAPVEPPKAEEPVADEPVADVPEVVEAPAAEGTEEAPAAEGTEEAPAAEATEETPEA